MFTKENYELIVTPNMTTNVEASICETIPENAFVKHFHISNQLSHGPHTRKYNKERCNGFTILILEEEGNYSYQVALCSVTENFSRLKGRYYVNLRALKEGFVTVPEEAFKYYPDNSFSKERAVIDWYIKTVLNKHSKKKDTVYLPGITTPVPLIEVSKPSFLNMFESLLLSIVGNEAISVKYAYRSKTDTTEAYLVLNTKEATEKETLEFSKIVENGLHKATVKRYVRDKPHKGVSRYYALYKLFKQFTSF